jgi:hypothetical protein
MSEDVLGIIAVTTGFVMIVGHLVRIIRTIMLQRTIREAIRLDSGLAAKLLDKIDEQQPEANSDDRTGLVLLALGAALFCYGLLQGGQENIREYSGTALFPIFVGAALLGRALYLDRSRRGK